MFSFIIVERESRLFDSLFPHIFLFSVLTAKNGRYVSKCFHPMPFNSILCIENDSDEDCLNNSVILLIIIKIAS